jgi:hypothetical protein
MENRITRVYKNTPLITAALFLSVVSFAQDKGIDVDINIKKESQWYQQPWVWVVGAAVFILLLAVILKGGKKNN